MVDDANIVDVASLRNVPNYWQPSLNPEAKSLSIDWLVCLVWDLIEIKVAEEGKWDPLFQGNLGWWNVVIWPEMWLPSGKRSHNRLEKHHVQ